MEIPSTQLLTDQAILQILALSPDATAIYTGEDVVIEMANDRMIGFWGKDRRIIGLPLITAVPELQGQDFVGILQEVWRTGITYEALERPAELNVDGSSGIFYFDFIYRAIKDPTGAMLCILHTATDVSERVRYSQQLRERENEILLLNKKLVESEAVFRNIFEQAPLGLTWLSGPDMLIEHANDPILKIWGRKADEVLNLPIAIARPELQGQSVLERLSKVYNTGEIQTNVEFKLRLQQGNGLRDAYVNSVYSPLRDQEGNVKGILAIVDDVTERVAERQRRELMEEQFRISVESAELGTWFVDAETRAFVTSVRLRELFGFYPHEEVTLDDAVGQIREDYRHAVAAAIDAAIENETAYDIEYPIIGFHDGKLRWVRATGKLYPAEHGTKPHFSGVLTDITARKLDEERKYDFIAIASHELKTPLTSIKAYIQMLLSRARTNHDDFYGKILEKVERQTERMYVLIKGLLDVSQMNSIGINLNKETFLVQALLDERVAETLLTAQRHEIIVEKCKPLTIHGDREKIGQVISNYLSNAIKYSPNGGKIILSCAEEPGYVKVSVTDQGIGISPQDVSKLFDRFYRVDNKYTQTISGFGIGLYLCAEIIRQHEGIFGVDSELKKGSTFFFKLPVGDL